MDGENNGKPYFLMDDLGVLVPRFSETSILYLPTFTFMQVNIPYMDPMGNSKYIGGRSVQKTCFFSLSQPMPGLPLITPLPLRDKALFSQVPGCQMRWAFYFKGGGGWQVGGKALDSNEYKKRKHTAKIKS